MNSLTFAIKFFTRLPWPREAKWEAKAAAGALGVLPLVGLLLGVWLAGGSYLITGFLGKNWAPILQAALLIFWEWIMGGSLFLDGFADTCDGVFSGTPPERALEIMHDSRIGSMGAIGLNLMFILKLGLMVQLLESASWPLWKFLIVYACWSKWLVSLAVFWLKAAKNHGLASFFQQERNPASWWAGTFMMAVSSVLLLPVRFWMVALPFSGLTVFGTGLWLQRRLGGQTGDTYGFLSQIAELSFLLAAVIGLS